MCVFRQNGIWWYEFTLNGKRTRKSAKTSDRDLAQLIEAEHRRSLKLGTGGISPTMQAIQAEDKASEEGDSPIAVAITPADSRATVRKTAYSQSYAAQPIPTREMNLRDAGELYRKNRIDQRRSKTLEGDATALHALLRFFGDLPLLEFHIGHFEHYQKKRKAAPSTVNHELGFLSRILKEAELWKPIKQHYHPLKNAAWQPPKIFTADEQVKLFRQLREDPDLELSEIVFNITRNTTASGCELRGLRLRNLELEVDPPRFHIPPEAAKNNIRPRTIPLNEDALEAFQRAVARASKLGSHYPEHYLFPFRVNRALYDPRKPASPSWLRKQVVQLRKKTGIGHLNPHVFRHLAVTELLEQGAPEQTVVALAGWISKRMFETYSHARIEAKADVVKLLDRSGHKAPAQSHPAPAPQLPTDIMHPAIQAEIARQVALALQQLNLAPSPQTQPVANGLRLIAFPGVAARPNGGSL